MTIEIRARVMANDMIGFEFHSRKFRVIVLEDDLMDTDDWECYSFKADAFHDEIKRVLTYTGADELLVLWENGNNLGWTFRKEAFIS